MNKDDKLHWWFNYIACGLSLYVFMKTGWIIAFFISFLNLWAVWVIPRVSHNQSYTKKGVDEK